MDELRALAGGLWISERRSRLSSNETGMKSNEKESRLDSCAAWTGERVIMSEGALTACSLTVRSKVSIERFRLEFPSRVSIPSVIPQISYTNSVSGYHVASSVVHLFFASYPDERFR